MVSTDPAYRITLRVPPSPRFAATVRDAITGFANLHGVSAYDVEPLLCALGEALANAIEHASTDDDLEIEAEVNDERISAVVTDRGRGLSVLPPTDMPLPQTLAERGRGIPIMQRCTDAFSIQSEPGRGTSIRLARFRTARKKERVVAK